MDSIKSLFFIVSFSIIPNKCYKNNLETLTKIALKFLQTYKKACFSQKSGKFYTF